MSADPIQNPIQQPDGYHHLAIMAGDMKAHLQFFTQVLGCPLVALFEMHGVEGASHAFLRLDDGCYFSVVYVPGGEKIETVMGQTHAGNGAKPCAPGTMQHVAFSVRDEAGLLAMRDRLRSHGLNVLGPIPHGFCKSIYFAGPENLTLEISYRVHEIDPKNWVDPVFLAKHDISAEEAQAMINPPPYTGPRPVPQPAYDPAQLHLHYEPEQYQQMLKMPDNIFESRPAYEAPVPNA